MNSTKLEQNKAQKNNSTQQNQGHVDRPHLSNECDGSMPISRNLICMPLHSTHHPTCESGLRAQRWGNTLSNSACQHSSGQQTINRCKQTSTTNKPNQSHQTNKFNVINKAITSITQCMCMCIVCVACVCCMCGVLVHVHVHIMPLCMYACMFVCVLPVHVLVCSHMFFTVCLCTHVSHM